VSSAIETVIDLKVESYSELIGSIEDINIHDIILSSNNPRSEINSIEELIESIKKFGLLQPIVVRNVENNFEVIAGVRRYTACRKLGWRKISCHIVDLDDRTAFEVSLIENIQRNSLNIMQESMAFKKYVTELGWGSVSELAKKISKSPSYVSKRIRLLELPQEVVNLISDSALDVTTAEELLTVKDKHKQHELALLLQNGHLSSRKVRQMVGNISAYDSKIKQNMESEEYFESFSTIEQQHDMYKCIDKAIITLKIAVRQLISIIENTEDSWIIYEILMQHKNMLVTQIDILIKERKKVKRLFSLRYL
jgi:ParB family chromosome partitioning protein